MRRPREVRRRAAFAVCLLVSCWAAAPRAQTLAMTPALQAVAAAADKEKELVVAGSGGLLGGAAGAKLIEQGINTSFGTHISLKWAPSSSYPELGNDIAVSYRNHLASPTDVYIAVGRDLAVFAKFDLFQAAPWPDYLPGRITDAVVEDGKYVKLYSGTLGFSYNTERAPSKPERLTDFLKPEWKGKFATTAFGAGWEQLAAKEAWGPAKTIAFAKDFAQQVGGFMLCTEPERLSSGEFLAFVTDCSGNVMVHAALDGAPIARVIAPESRIITYGYGAIPKNAAHPNAARLYIVYLLTEAGQKFMWDVNSIDLHLLAGSRTEPQIAAVEQKFGFRFVDGNVAWQSTNDAGNAAQREVTKILQESGK